MDEINEAVIRLLELVVNSDEILTDAQLGKFLRTVLEKADVEREKAFMEWEKCAKIRNELAKEIFEREKEKNEKIL